MAKALVLAEKPSVARDIARVLGVKGSRDTSGYMESDQWVITWAIGHLVALAEPEGVDPKYKAWKLETLPILPEHIPLRVLPNTKKQFDVVKKLMHRSDIDQLICATDSGREGELIFRYIYAEAQCRKPWRRLWISSMTDEAIRDGFQKLRPGADYESLYQSARCRSEADWLVGMNASRAYSITYDAWLSIGRVQTPTLALICRRDAEIADFKPEDYYEVQAAFAPADSKAAASRSAAASKARKTLTPRTGEYIGTWIDNADKRENPSRIKSQEQAQQIADYVKGREGRITDVVQQKLETPPPLLYDLTSLQRDANRLLNLSAKQTLDVAQSLYEKHKAITYPRTDSRHLTHDMAGELPAVFQAIRYGYQQILPPNEAVTGSAGNRRIFDDSKVSDHHAIIPTKKAVNLSSLSASERSVYDLIVRRLCAAFYPPYRYMKTTIETLVEPHYFISKGAVELDKGWRAVYDGIDEGEKSTPLPDVKKGETRLTRDAITLAKKTQPPKPYTDATLLAAMENAGNAVDDESLRQAMKDSGLGTPATRAATIERLIEVGYIKRSGKALKATPKAISLIAVVPPELMSAETTGKWEKALTKIARGESRISPDDFMASIKRFTEYIVNDARTRHVDVKFENDRPKTSKVPNHYLTGVRCPLCQSRILESSRAYGCERWREGCKYTLWKNALERSGIPEIIAANARKLLKGETCVIDGKSVKLVNNVPVIVN